MDKIKRIEQLDRQIKIIEGMISQGEHVGAGLTVSIGVGPRSDDFEGMSLELTHQTGEILALVLKSLRDSRTTMFALAKQDHARLSQFLDILEPKVQ